MAYEPHPIGDKFRRLICESATICPINKDPIHGTKRGIDPIYFDDKETQRYGCLALLDTMYGCKSMGKEWYDKNDRTFDIDSPEHCEKIRSLNNDLDARDERKEIKEMLQELLGKKAKK